jgi:hypothetical protein
MQHNTSAVSHADPLFQISPHFQVSKQRLVIEIRRQEIARAIEHRQFAFPVFRDRPIYSIRS